MGHWCLCDEHELELLDKIKPLKHDEACLEYNMYFKKILKLHISDKNLFQCICD